MLTKVLVKVGLELGNGEGVPGGGEVEVSVGVGGNVDGEGVKVGGEGLGELVDCVGDALGSLVIVGVTNVGLGLMVNDGVKLGSGDVSVSVGVMEGSKLGVILGEGCMGVFVHVGIKVVGVFVGCGQPRNST